MNFLLIRQKKNIGGISSVLLFNILSREYRGKQGETGRSLSRGDGWTPGPSQETTALGRRFVHNLSIKSE